MELGEFTHERDVALWKRELRELREEIAQQRRLLHRLADGRDMELVTIAADDMAWMLDKEDGLINALEGGR